MKNIFLTAAVLFCNKALFAQATQHTANIAQADLNASIQTLTQNALSLLIGIVVFAAFAWLICIVMSCANLSKKMNRNLLAALFFFCAIVVTPAQTSLSHATTMNLMNPINSYVLDSIDLLQQYAPTALTIFMLTLAFAWIGYLFHGFFIEKKSDTKKITVSPLFLLVCFGLLGNSCTAAQRAQAAEIRAAQAAENRNCPMNQHLTEPSNLHNYSLSGHQGYSKWYAPVFCKFCGKRIQRSSL